MPSSRPPFPSSGLRRLLLLQLRCHRCEYLVRSTGQPVPILDVDYHHGKAHSKSSTPEGTCCMCLLTVTPPARIRTSQAPRGERCRPRRGGHPQHPSASRLRRRGIPGGPRSGTGGRGGVRRLAPGRVAGDGWIRTDRTHRRRRPDYPRLSRGRSARRRSRDGAYSFSKRVVRPGTAGRECPSVAPRGRGPTTRLAFGRFCGRWRI